MKYIRYFIFVSLLSDTLQFCFGHVIFCLDILADLSWATWTNLLWTFYILFGHLADLSWAMDSFVMDILHFDGILLIHYRHSLIYDIFISIFLCLRYFTILFRTFSV